jgi:hypothetical protein
MGLGEGARSDPVRAAAAFCELLAVWKRYPYTEPAHTVLMESLRWFISPLSGWGTDRGLGLAREIITALESPGYDSPAGHAPEDADVCYVRILDRPAGTGAFEGAEAQVVLTLVRCGDGRWRIHGIGDRVPAWDIPRPG